MKLYVLPFFLILPFLVDSRPVPQGRLISGLKDILFCQTCVHDLDDEDFIPPSQLITFEPVPGGLGIYRPSDTSPLRPMPTIQENDVERSAESSFSIESPGDTRLQADIVRHSGPTYSWTQGSSDARHGQQPESKSTTSESRTSSPNSPQPFPVLALDPRR